MSDKRQCLILSFDEFYTIAYLIWYLVVTSYWVTVKMQRLFIKSILGYMTESAIAIFRSICRRVPALAALHSAWFHYLLSISIVSRHCRTGSSELFPEPVFVWFRFQMFIVEFRRFFLYRIMPFAPGDAFGTVFLKLLMEIKRLQSWTKNWKCYWVLVTAFLLLYFMLDVSHNVAML